MNTLSWLIYLSSIVGVLKGATFVGAVLLLVLGIVCLFISKAPWDRYASDGDEGWQAKMEFRKYIGKISRVSFLTAVIALPIGIFTPTKSALYMIAASELGEMVVTSPEAREIMNDMKDVIKKNLKEQLGDS